LDIIPGIPGSWIFDHPQWCAVKQGLTEGLLYCIPLGDSM